MWLIREGAGEAYRPEDYLTAFARFVRENPERIEAIRILLNRPQDWSTDALAELRQKLAATRKRFTVEKLQKVHAACYGKALVDIISMVKHAAKDEEPLLTASERVDKAIDRITSGQEFTEEQQRWLGRIRSHLVANLSIGREAIDDVPVFAREGGWGRADRAFGGWLSDLLKRINEAVAA